MTSTCKEDWGCLEICHVFVDSIFLNNRSFVQFCRQKVLGEGGGGVAKSVFFCEHQKCVTPFDYLATSFPRVCK